MFKGVKNEVLPVAIKLLEAGGDQSAFAREVRTCYADQLILSPCMKHLQVRIMT